MTGHPDETKPGETSMRAHVDRAAVHLGQALGFARAVYLLATDHPLTDPRDVAALAAISRVLVESLDAADGALMSALAPDT